MATLEESRLVQSMVTLPRNKPETQLQDGGSLHTAFTSCMPSICSELVIESRLTSHGHLSKWKTPRVVGLNHLETSLCPDIGS